MDTEFQFCKISKFWKFIAKTCVLNPNELHTYKWLRWYTLCYVYFTIILSNQVLTHNNFRNPFAEFLTSSKAFSDKKRQWY